MWANSGSGLKSISDNLVAGNAKLDHSWNGNAADAAYAYFDKLQKEVDKLGDGMKDLETHYKNVALALSRPSI